MPFVSGSYSDQLAAIGTRQTYDARVATAAGSPNTNAAVAQGTVAHANAYPWMDPQTAYALAANGNQPGDPLSKQVAVASLNKKGGGFWHSLGHIASAPLRAAVSLGETTIGGAQHYGKAAARLGLTAAETPYQVGVGVVRDVGALGGAAGDIAAGALSGAATGAAVGLIGGGTLGSAIPVLGNIVGAIGGVTGGALIGAGVGGAAGGLAHMQGHDIESKHFENPLAQSTAGQAIGSLVTGHGVDLGSGFLPGGKVRAAQVKAAQDTASIDGHALTPGRILASGVAQPGSTPYNLLSGVTDAITAWELDPSRYALEEYSAQRAAGKLIEGVPTAKMGPLSRAIGRLDSADPAVDVNKTREFLTTDTRAQRFIQKATETTSASEIRAASNGKIPTSIANQLAAHTTEQGVLDTLLSGVEGGELRYKDAVRNGRGALSVVPTFRPGARLASVMDRLGGVLPEHSIDLQDIGTGADHKLDNAVDQMDNFLKQGRYSRADRAPILDRLMATTTAQEARQVFADTVHGDLRQRLQALDMPDNAIQRVLKTKEADRQLLLDHVSGEVADATVPKSVMVGDEHIPINKANEVLEANTVHYQLPDARAVKRMTTPSDSLRAIYNSRGFLETEHAADWFMGSWKKLNLARPALAMRMLSMGQAKMAANGLETDLADPVNLFNMVLHRAPRPAELEGLVAGSPLSQAEELQRIGSRMATHLAPEELAAHQTILRPGDEGFAKAWSARVAELHADPVARAAATDGLESTANSFWDGALEGHRYELADDLGRPELATSREAADAYVHGEVASHLEGITANDPEMMAAIGSGSLGEIPVLAVHPGGVVNPALADALAGRAADTAITVPNEVRAAKAAGKLVDPDYGNKVGRVTGWFYSNMVGKPMNALIQHPSFNQFYWQAVADHVGMLDETGAAALRSRLASESAAVRMPESTRSAIERALDHPSAGNGAVKFNDVDKLAKADAVGKLQGMTIDMSKKTGWQDSMRHMVPFAKHWQQETTQWAKLAVNNPQAFRKGQMVVQGAQGSGFFHKDDNGAYVFNYPGSGIVGKVITGTPFPMQAKAAGLAQMTTDIMPGAGPIVSIAASKLLPNTPEFDDVRHFLAPYGDPTAQGVEGAVLPPWLKSLKAGLSKPDSADTANTTMQVARYLVSTGKYSMDSPDNIDKTLTEAGSRAKNLLKLQAIGKFVLPSSPTLQPMAEDKDGRTVVAKILSTDLAQMRKDDYEHSTENFLAKYGDNALLFMQATTRPLRTGSASTTEQEDFLRSNPGLADKFPDLAAFFAPQGSQTFDIASLSNQIAAGTRQRLTPDQQVQLANKQVGSMVYYQAKNSLGPRTSTAQQAILSQLKGVLRDKYPGFDVPIVGLGTRLTDDPQSVEKVVVPELNRALADPKLANSDTGKAVAQYLQVRQAVAAAAKQRGLTSFQTATKAADLRGILRQAAHILGQDNAGFSLMFDELLDREMKTDTADVAVPSV